MERYYDFELEQFTGLKDRYGVDIYDGDILTFDYADCKEFKDWMKNPCYTVGYEKDYIICGTGIKKDSKLYLHGFRFKHTEILGNIRENINLI